MSSTYFGLCGAAGLPSARPLQGHVKQRGLWAILGVVLAGHIFA